MRIPFFLPCVALVMLGCNPESEPTEFGDLQPVSGTVRRGGAPVRGGVVRFTAQPDSPEFLINAEVGPDGSYRLATVRSTDSRGERKPGAPMGTYRVSYTPPLSDQTAGNRSEPVSLPKAVTIAAGNNDLRIDLPRK